MALESGINSYISLEVADAYFERRMDAAAWTSAPDETKEQALMTATLQLENLSWSGSIASSTQPLAWPRMGEYYDPRIGYSVSMGSDIPQRIQYATAELAYHLLNNDGLLDDTGRVVNVQVGSISLDRIIQATLMPLAVKRLITPLLNGGSSRSWWRAN